MIPTIADCARGFPISWRRATARSTYCLRWPNGWLWRRRQRSSQCSTAACQYPASATAWRMHILRRSLRTWRPSLTLRCPPRPLFGTRAPTRAESVRTNLEIPKKRSSCTNSTPTENAGCARWWYSSLARCKYPLTRTLTSTASRRVFALQSSGI